MSILDAIETTPFTLAGTVGADRLEGEAGNDVLSGLSGNDILGGRGWQRQALRRGRQGHAGGR
ncbi:hypothetical protein [Microvirga lotononidis]|uniref:hypothetical protein n=1 Tax=Microvirga lotononidis TaxID=864069 RepID=UPI003898FD51